MFKRSFSAAGCGALFLLLTVAQSSPAQFVTFPVGRGTIGAFGPMSYGYYPSTFSSPYYGSPYSTGLYGGYNPSFYRSSYSSYYVTPVTPLYYGAASFAPAYSTAYTPPRLVSPPLDSLANLERADSAAYAAPAYPLRSPDYSVIYPISPPLSQLAGNTAKVDVRVEANAELCFDGHATSQTGADRSFTTPALEQNQDYVYEICAHWDAHGKRVDQTRKVTVRAGDHVVVDFHQTTAAK